MDELSKIMSICGRSFYKRMRKHLPCTYGNHSQHFAGATFLKSFPGRGRGQGDTGYAYLVGPFFGISRPHSISRRRRGASYHRSGNAQRPARRDTPLIRFTTHRCRGTRHRIWHWRATRFHSPMVGVSMRGDRPGIVQRSAQNPVHCHFQDNCPRHFRRHPPELRPYVQQPAKAHAQRQVT